MLLEDLILCVLSTLNVSVYFNPYQPYERDSLMPILLVGWTEAKRCRVTCSQLRNHNKTSASGSLISTFPPVGNLGPVTGGLHRAHALKGHLPELQPPKSDGDCLSTFEIFYLLF